MIMFFIATLVSDSAGLASIRRVDVIVVIVGRQWDGAVDLLKACLLSGVVAFSRGVATQVGATLRQRVPLHLALEGATEVRLRPYSCDGRRTAAGWHPRCSLEPALIHPEAAIPQGWKRFLFQHDVCQLSPCRWWQKSKLLVLVLTVTCQLSHQEWPKSYPTPLSTVPLLCVVIWGVVIRNAHRHTLPLGVVYAALP